MHNRVYVKQKSLDLKTHEFWFDGTYNIKKNSAINKDLCKIYVTINL